MAAYLNPALEAFVAEIGDEFVLAQVLIRRAGAGYELRHERDRGTPVDALRLVQLADLRALAQFTADGAFRPLKAAANLQSGWRLAVGSKFELECAVNRLYPGAIADGYASRSDTPPVTHYREMVQRQSGIYRITAFLNDTQAGQVASACCHKRFCLKRRLWTVEGLALDSAGEKSWIPCLEPCAILLEFARKAMRLEQEDRIRLELSAGEITSLRAALHAALESATTPPREADFEAPGNLRRLALLVQKLAGHSKPLTLETKL